MAHSMKNGREFSISKPPRHICEVALSQAYVVGFSLSYSSILEMMLRLSIPCGALSRSHDENALGDIMWVLCDASTNNVALLEAALAAMAGRPVLLITYDDLGGLPRYRKAFLAEIHIPVPETCAIKDIPRRAFRSDDMAYLSRVLGMGVEADELIMRRWDDRQLDLRIDADILPPDHGTLQITARRVVALQLPVELIDQILSHLRVPQMDDDIPLWWIPHDTNGRRSRAALTSSSLVCQTWLPIARRHLLFTTNLYLSRRTVRSFIELLKSPVWRPYVRRLYVNFPFRCDATQDSITVALVNVIVQSLPRLHALHFDNVGSSFVTNGHYLRLHLPNALDSFGFRVIGLGHVGPSNDHAHRFTPHVNLVLPRLPRLRTLCLSGVTLDDWEGNPSLSQIRRLFLHWVQPAGINGFPNFLASLRDTPLETLALAHTTVSSRDVQQLTIHSTSLRQFRYSALMQAPGRISWTDGSRAEIQEQLRQQVDSRWAFPHLPEELIRSTEQLSA